MLNVTNSILQLYRYRFAGQTLSSKSLVLVTILIGANSKLTVSCEKMIIGSMLLAELKETLKNG